MRIKHFYLAAVVITAFACGDNHETFEGSGVFEAHEVVVSAEVGGQMTDFQIDEGTPVQADQVVGHVDCQDLSLQKSQVEATKAALQLKQVEAFPETSVLEKQITTQEAQITILKTQADVVVTERDRVKKLVAQESAPSKQLDDIQGELDVLQKKIAAAETQLGVLQQQIRSAQQSSKMHNRSIMSEEGPLASQITRLDSQIEKCIVINPITGRVIAKYVEAHEFVTPGKPLYKVADLDHMILRAYLSGDQLTSVQLGQAVKVMVDDGKKNYKAYDGTISWIADKAEFTPKTIQTKDERANLVYAVKVDVKNDGFLRIGMYGELDF